MRPLEQVKAAYDLLSVDKNDAFEAGYKEALYWVLNEKPIDENQQKL